jgi:hypothetical protein
MESAGWRIAGRVPGRKQTETVAGFHVRSRLPDDASAASQGSGKQARVALQQQITNNVTFT